MINYFIPLIGIGDFELNTNLSDYAERFDLKYSPVDESTEWETYSLEDEGVYLYVENNKIISIVSDLECLYNGRNIIGMNINEFINFYGIEPIGEPDALYVNENEFQIVYEFDDIGLQVWCLNDVIETVIASDY